MPAVRPGQLKPVVQAHAVPRVAGVAVADLRQQRDLVVRGLGVVRRGLLDLRASVCVCMLRVCQYVLCARARGAVWGAV